MKLRTHTYSTISYILSCAIIGVMLGFLVVGNISRAYAEALDSEDETETISDTHFVTFHENGESLTIKTDAKTVEEAISRAKIELAEDDLTDPERPSKIDSDNYHINIYRARPVVVTDGLTKKYIMSASYDKETVAKAAGFTIYDGDEIKIASATENLLETGLTDTYEIKRAGGSTITVEEKLDYEEITEPDDSLAAGQKKVKQVGEFGKKVTTYEVKFKDGKEIERTKKSEEVVKEPVDKITLVGTKVAEATARPDRATCESWMRAAGIAEKDMDTAYWIIFKESKCRYNAQNARSGAYGIPQALPGKKMASAGSDWETNPVTQIKWMISYVNGRYGGWAGAKKWWEEHKWY